MFNEVKNKMGYLVFKKKLYKQYKSSCSFNDFVENSSNCVIILPLNDIDFANSFDVSKYFRIHKKEVTLFVPEHKVNTFDITSHYKYISYSFNDISKLGLPTKKFIEKLNNYEFDILIDLERENNLFLAAVTSLIKADYKIGFNKSGIENLYNFQLVNTKNNSEISYRNLLNSLKMF